MWLLMITTRLLRCEMCVVCRCGELARVLRSGHCSLQCHGNCYQATCPHALQLRRCGSLWWNAKCYFLFLFFDFTHAILSFKSRLAAVILMITRCWWWLHQLRGSWRTMEIKWVTASSWQRGLWRCLRSQCINSTEHSFQIVGHLVSSWCL